MNLLKRTLIVALSAGTLLYMASCESEQDTLLFEDQAVTVQSQTSINSDVRSETIELTPAVNFGGTFTVTAFASADSLILEARRPTIFSSQFVEFMRAPEVVQDLIVNGKRVRFMITKTTRANDRTNGTGGMLRLAFHNILLEGENTPVTQVNSFSQLSRNYDIRIRTGRPSGRVIMDQDFTLSSQ